MVSGAAPPRTPVPQPRSSIGRRRLRQITTKVEILGPAIFNIVPNHVAAGVLVAADHFIDLMRTGAGWYRRGHSAHQVIIGGRNQASHFPGGRAAKWAT
jgi:hypothetical protein